LPEKNVLKQTDMREMKQQHWYARNFLKTGRLCETDIVNKLTIKIMTVETRKK